MGRRKRDNKWLGIANKYKIYSTRKLTEISNSYDEPSDFEKVVAERPYYTLIRIVDKTFQQADSIILKLYPSFKGSLERCKWACWSVLKKNESEGNTRMSATALAQIIWKDYPEVKQHIYQAVTEYADDFHYDEDKKIVALDSTFRAEKRIAEEILARVKRSDKLDIDWNKYTNVDGFELTDEQKNILELICNKNVVMLNGSAGTGKTSAMKALVRMLEENEMYCTILAPTGIAAKRIAEVTQHSASTIHKHLASHHSIGDVLIIDEMSMVGVNLLGTLFLTLPSYTKIVFVCDEAQLASISCGNIVQDIIDSHMVPIVNLTKVFRYGIGGIATVATDVRMGKKIDADMKFNDYSFIETSSNPLNQIVAAYDGLRQTYDVNDIMILSPFNVRETGTYAINKEIQSRYNDNPTVVSYTRQSTEIDFKIGDKIVNTENNYHMESIIPDTDIAVMNGERGDVVGFEDNCMIVEFENGTAVLEKADIYKQLLAYSISVHKSQGSQAKAVIVIADKSHGFFLTRNLLYVALSRAQEKLIFIGDIGTINNSLYKEENKLRETWLKELLTDKENT